MTLSSPVTELKGVGEALGNKFATLGISTVSDLLNYFPRRYDDYSLITPIRRLKPGKVTIEAKLSNVTNRYVRRGMVITEAIATDSDDNIKVVWFNQPYRQSSTKKDALYLLSGKYERRNRYFTLTNPTTELASNFPINTGRIVPVYRQNKDVSSRELRRALKEALPALKGLKEILPDWIIDDKKLMNRPEALRAIHFPESTEQLKLAEARLGLEEVFELILASLFNKYANQNEQAIKIPYNEKLAVKFSKSLPFKLTDSQRLAAARIYRDLEKAHPMNRLVEGDVGSGKTVVATMAALMALEQGWQVAFMAPTEVVARQHADTIRSLLQPLGREGEVLSLVGSMSSAQKSNAQKAISNGDAKFIVGTHTLIQEKIDMSELVLAIIDEQHRFGVEQRKTLMNKAGHMPHVLSMTATPIPRSLALTLYGDLDVSILSDMPKGRQPVITKITPPSGRERLYKQLDLELNQGRQMFVVCPLISESAVSDYSSAERIYEQLSQQYFKHRRVGLLHGKLKPEEKISVMRQFIDHELDILVSTTVIEVGVDVPNATIMVIEGPERFGLAQLHQLRGRVGRGEHQGSCYLMLSDSKAPTVRLRALESSNDGFYLAERDLELRGPGSLMLGTRQHGSIGFLRIADLSNIELLKTGRQLAMEFLSKDSLDKYPELKGIIEELREIIYLD